MRRRPIDFVALLQGRLWHGVRLATLAVLLCAGGGRASSQVDTHAAEYHIKAAFLCKFGNYVEWPAQSFAGPEGAFTIGVVGDADVVDEVTRTARGLSVNDWPIVVRKLRHGDAMAGVHILFVTGSSEVSLADWLGAAKGQPVFTVTESPHGTALGSTLNFVVVDNKVRFDISPPMENGLKISSRLLGIARKVVPRSSS